MPGGPAPAVRAARVLPGENPLAIDPTWLNATTFAAGGLNVEDQLPYVLLFNGDTIAHTFTLVSAGKLPGINPTTVVGAGLFIAVPTNPFSLITIDSAGNIANVWAVYSDLPSFAPGGGSLATSVTQVGLTGAGTTSATLVMAGWGSSVFLTPKVSGKVEISVTGDVVVATSVNWGVFQLYYGTGTAPTSGAAVVGTALGSAFTFRPGVVTIPGGFSITELATLTVGTAYWFDIAYNANSSSDTISISVADVVVKELLT